MSKYVRIKNITVICNRNVEPFNGKKLYVSTGGLDDEEKVEYVTYDNKPSRANVSVLEGDVLIAKMKNTNKTTLIRKTDENNIYSTGFMVLRGNKVDNRYLYYLLSSDEFISQKDLYSNGTTQMAINNEKYKLIYVNYVDIPNLQIKIADYLDNRCSKIDRVIEDNNKEIELLKEYKLNIIDEVIDNSNMKKCHLGLIANMKNGLNFRTVHNGTKISFLSVGDLTDDLVIDDIEKFSTIDIKSTISEEALLQNGDIVFVRSNGSKDLVGRSIMVDKISYPLAYSGFCIRLRNLRKDILIDKYLLLFFRSSYFKNELRKMSRGTNINNLSQELLSQISVIVPSLDNQMKCINKVMDTYEKIDKVIEYRKKIIEKLEEYKKSLIYEVVTGKKEV